MDIIEPLKLESKETVGTTVMKASQRSPDLFTRIKGRDPVILWLEMEGLEGARKLDMLDDGYTEFQDQINATADYQTARCSHFGITIGNN